MPACREEIARHARLADELRLPSFQWYAPLWAATEAALAGRFADAERLAGAGARGGRARRRRQRRAVRRRWSRSSVHWSSGSSSTARDMAFLQDKVANSPAGPAYRVLPLWTLAGLGRPDEARSAPGRWMRPRAGLRRQLALRAGRGRRGDRPARRPDARAAPLRPARALRRPPRDGRPGRDQLRRHRPPPRRPRRRARPPRRGDRHLHAAIERDAELGCTVWRLHGLRLLHASRPTTRSPPRRRASPTRSDCRTSRPRDPHDRQRALRSRSRHPRGLIGGIRPRVEPAPRSSDLTASRRPCSPALPKVELGPLDWPEYLEYLRVVGVPAGLLSGANPRAAIHRDGRARLRDGRLPRSRPDPRVRA